MTALSDLYKGTRDRRRFNRVRLSVIGRYMLINGREYVCRTRDMSPGGLALIAPALGKVGERVIAYVEHFGRLEGRIVRSFSIGFAINLAATEHKRAKIATELAKLVDQQNLPEVIDS